MNDLPAIGTFIKVMRQPKDEGIRTLTGCKGFVTLTMKQGKTDKGIVPEDCVFVMLLTNPEAKPVSWQPDGRVESVNTTTDSIYPGDFDVITAEEAGPVIQGMLKHWRKEQEEPDDPKLEAFMEEIESKEWKDSCRKEQEERDAYAAGKTNPYLPKRAVTRQSKHDYPTLNEDIEAAGYGQKQRHIACGEKISTEDAVHLCWLNEASDRVCFWSGKPQVRRLVQELDLDPYTDRFNTVLYKKEKTVLVEPAKLRTTVIEALNKGLVILDIDDGYLDGKMECCCSMGREGTHFFVTTGKRRKLPLREECEAGIDKPQKAAKV
jgi:hypothetical protein